MQLPNDPVYRSLVGRLIGNYDRLTAGQPTIGHEEGFQKQGQRHPEKRKSGQRRWGNVPSQKNRQGKENHYPNY